MFFFKDIIRRNESKFIKMADLSNFKRGPIVGVSETKTTELFGLTRSNASKIMIAFEKNGKNIPH